MPQVLYHEIVGGGADTEHNHANGIVVILSYWKGGDYRTPDHYILSRTVMVEREIIHTLTALDTKKHYDNHTRKIREAVALVDTLKTRYPQAVPNE